MNPRHLSFLVLSFSVTHSFSQNKGEPDISNVTTITILDPGVSYEARIGKFQSLYFHGFMAVSASLGYSEALGFISDFHLDPALEMQYRHYYNAARRLSKGKRVEMNSLNYLCASFETIFSKMRIYSENIEEKKVRAINTIGLAWGMQRNYRKHFSLDLNLGVGYFFTKGTDVDNAGNPYPVNLSKVTAIGHLTLGIWLNNRN